MCRLFYTTVRTTVRYLGPGTRLRKQKLKVSFPPHAAIRHVVHHRRGAPNRTNENKYYLR